jgi:tetratricopeptide (TPR) repeat protein
MREAPARPGPRVPLAGTFPRRFPMSADAHAIPRPIAPRRVLLVGWDAADGKIVDALLAAGALPALHRMVAEGAIGELAGVGAPIAPLAWTTIATGVRPDRHGILAEVEPDAGAGGWRAVSARSRHAKALWNVATQAGLRSIVVGWAASHPAEPILGACVDERFAAITGPVEAAWPIAEGSVHPPELVETLAALRLHPSELRREELTAFVPALAEIDLAKDLRPLHLAECVARTVSLHAVATELLERQEWLFAAIRYPLLGHLAAAFLRCRPPRGEGVPEADVARYGGVIDSAYVLLDGMLARLRELAGAETTVILVSECGVRAGAVGGEWRRPAGLAAIAGPGTRPDGLLHGASHLDLAPTVLALLGLPAGADLPGRVLSEAFAAPPTDRRIPSWETLPGACGRLPAEPTPTPWEQHEAVRQLVALGYAPSDPATEARDAAVAALAELRRATVHLDAGEWRPAIEPLRRAIAARSGDLQARLMLATALIMAGGAGDLAECRALADAAAADPRLAPFAEAIRGLLASAEGRDADALAHFQTCERNAPPSAFVLDRLGWAYLRLRQLDDAERVFRRSLELEPDGRFAPFALAGIHLERNRPEEAAEEALRALGRQYRWPEAHARLGIALARLGRVPEAMRAFEVSIAQRPTPLAHDCLADLVAQTLGDRERVTFHRDRASELRNGRAGP